MRERDGLWLVMSSAYIGAELAAEFGNLPPAFLPVGSARLYEYQLARISAGRTVYLTIPEGFEPNPEDLRRLQDFKVSLIPIPDGMRLGEAVVYAVNSIGEPDQALRILHGDTLIDDLSTGEADIVAVANLGDGYSWAQVDVIDGRILKLETIAAGSEYVANRPVATGFFVFSSSTAFVRAVTRARGDFIDGINRYARDVALRPLRVESWYDFGHAQTYFRSRRAVTTARAFNALRLDGRTARKSSQDGHKMRAEADWLRQVPPQVQLYCVRVLDAGTEGGQEFYETEYQYIPTLSELFVFGALGRPAWSRIADACAEFLDICAANPPSDIAAAVGNTYLHKLAIGKTMARLDDYARATGFDIDHDLIVSGRPVPSLSRMAQEFAQIVGRAPERPAVIMHGDFCFSNILFDSRTNRIKVIDPRGYIDVGAPSVFGDTRYDLAKLARSVIGRYDQIIAGRYSLTVNDRYSFSLSFERSTQLAWLHDMFADITVAGTRLGSSEVSAIMAGLFLSMLPLHADRPDRQQAYIANAARLYRSFDES